MKNIIILTSGLCILCANTYAATRCVNLNSSMTCTATIPSYADNYGGLDWSTTCGDVAVSGISACARYTQATSKGTVATELQTFNDGSSRLNYGCWCKMTSPAVSKWVYTQSGGAHTDACLQSCAKTCIALLLRDTTFKNAMFSNLIN